LDFTLKRMSEVYFHLTPLFVDNSTDTGLTILYDPPSDVGADRIVDAVAASHKYGTPCVVVDFGTATNFEVIDEGGRYLGGVITPGISISTDALFARAARLPRVGIERPHNVIGTSTVTAIQSGLYYGYAGLVDGILRRMIEELGRRPRVVATGGLAPLIATASEFIDEVDLTLTLDGLRLVYERVRGASA
jgi:type III pantothenate kinase